MFETHDPYPIKGFRGLYLRGPAETCPPDRLLGAFNVVFRPGTVMTRRGANPYLTAGAFTIADLHYYFAAGDYHALHSTPAGEIRKDFLAPVILTIPGWDGKFQMVQNGEFIFILPSLETANLYVWKTDWATAREAGALAPSGMAMIAADGAAQPNVPVAGDWIFGVVYETDSFFFSKIGPYNAGTKVLTKHTSSGAHTIELSNVPLGPSNTIARHIVVSRPIAATTFDGNFDAHELFFMPGDTGKIADNVTTTLSIPTLYDQDLVRSADYLHERLERIPNARGITTISDRLVLYGDKDDRNAIRISKLADFEGFNSVDGVITTPVKTEEGIYAIGELRGTYYIFKEGATIAYADTSEFPSEWEFIIVDRARTVTHVAEIIQDVNGVNDSLFVTTESGQLWSFNGIFQTDLSFFVPGLIDDALQIIVIPDENYVLIRNSNNHILYMDYSEGLTESAVKWSQLGYDEPGTLLKILAQPLEFTGVLGNVAPEFVYADKVLRGHPTNANGNITGDDNTHPIDWNIELPPQGGPHGINHWIGYQLRIRSENVNTVTLKVSAWKRDSGSATEKTILVTNGRSYDKLINIVSETLKLKLTGDAAFGNPLGEFIELEAVTVFGKLLWTRRYGNV